MITVYGITQCNSVKKAREWFNEHHIEINFVDFKKNPPREEDVSFWLEHIPQDILLNKKGTTWRNLTETEKEKAQDRSGAITTMLEKPSIIKRPVVVVNQHVMVGFDADAYARFVLR